VKVAIETLPRKKWKDVKSRCAGQIGSLLELLQGRLSKNVMAVVTDRNNGLFPLPGEISLNCSCPDWAVMCKHVAAVLYGVGARLDENPELLFLLRGVDHEELISAEVGVAAAAGANDGRRWIAEDALADVFGIEMAEDANPPEAKRPRRRKPPAPESAKASNEPAKRAGAPKAKGRKHATRTEMKPAPRKAEGKKASRVAPRARPVTGKTVAALRTKLGMSQNQFAQLLGVSALSINNWEKKSGKLTLRARTLDAWNAAKRLTKKQAWQKLNAL
jgi:uncharacterized Zn finger protein/DNA-binding XRE family transcriptional regulator